MSGCRCVIKPEKPPHGGYFKLTAAYLLYFTSIFGILIMDKGGSVPGEIVGREGIIYADVDPNTVLEPRQRNP